MDLEESGREHWPAEEYPPLGSVWRVPRSDRLLEGEGRALVLSQVGLERDAEPLLEVVLCRVDGVLFALDSTCPHSGGRIQGGPLVEGRWARCPLHWFDFDPKSGRCMNADCPPAGTFSVEERDGWAWIRRAPGEPVRESTRP